MPPASSAAGRRALPVLALVLAGLLTAGLLTGCMAQPPALVYLGAAPAAPGIDTARLVPQLVAAPAPPGPPEQVWRASWAAAPQAPGATGASATGVRKTTVRTTVRLSAGGTTLRLRLSNAYGRVPLTVSAASIVNLDAAVTLGAAQPTPVRFGGQTELTLAAGAAATSDPVALAVPALGQLSVNLFFRDVTGPLTWHPHARAITSAATGDRTGDPSNTSFTPLVEGRILLSGVDVLDDPGARTVVTIGDSITDGSSSTVGEDRRYPDALARTLLTADPQRRWSVANAGISGNRILAGRSVSGASALSRLARDVIATPGVSDVVWLQGLNDIGMAHATDPGVRPQRAVTAATIIAGLQQGINELHGAGLRVYGATLPPFQDARPIGVDPAGSFYSAAGEAERQAVNDWIRTSGAYDGIVDLAAVLADAGQPLRLRSDYDSGDHLHPNDAGYQAIAVAVAAVLVSHAPPVP